MDFRKIVVQLKHDIQFIIYKLSISLIMVHILIGDSGWTISCMELLFRRKFQLSGRLSVEL